METSHIFTADTVPDRRRGLAVRCNKKHGAAGQTDVNLKTTKPKPDAQNRKRSGEALRVAFEDFAESGLSTLNLLGI